MFVLGFLISAIVVPTVLAQLQVFTRRGGVDFGFFRVDKVCDNENGAALYVTTSVGTTRDVSSDVLPDGCKK
jgi:hypothetical protein